MNKTHLIIIVFGLAGCLAMMLIMGRLLRLQPGRAARGSVAKRFAERFAPELEKPPSLLLKKKLDPKTGVAEGVDLVAKVWPKPTTDIDRMIVVMASFLWRQKLEQGAIDSVQIRWWDPKSGESSRVQIRRPSGRSRPRRQVQWPKRMPVRRR